MIELEMMKIGNEFIKIGLITATLISIFAFLVSIPAVFQKESILEEKHEPLSLSNRECSVNKVDLKHFESMKSTKNNSSTTYFHKVIYKNFNINCLKKLAWKPLIKQYLDTLSFDKPVKMIAFHSQEPDNIIPNWAISPSSLVEKTHEIVKFYFEKSVSKGDSIIFKKVWFGGKEVKNLNNMQ